MDGMNAVTKTQTMKITKIKEYIGAEVTGIDLRQPVDEVTRKRLNQAVADHTVLVIRGQEFTPAQYQAAARLFGDLMEDQNRRYLVDGHPLVSVLSNRHRDSNGNPAKVATNSTWHTDHTNQEVPPKFTMLYPMSLPSKGGGTSVCNMQAAFNALPEALKQRITPMKTENTLISSARFKIANPDILKAQKELMAKKPPTIQPLVRTHPETGAKAIWFHKSKTEKIIGMTPEDTQVFLQELLDTAIRPEFAYVHEYKLGDMLIIDDRSTMHKAGFDFDHSQHRLLYRILVRGDRPV